MYYILISEPWRNKHKGKCFQARHGSNENHPICSILDLFYPCHPCPITEIPSDTSGSPTAIPFDIFCCYLFWLLSHITRSLSFQHRCRKGCKPLNLQNLKTPKMLSVPVNLYIHFITLHSTTSHHISSHHTTLQHIIIHHIKSHHNITLHCITSYHITSHHKTSQHITSHDITWHHIKSHDITLHYITSHQTTLHYNTSQHITLHCITSYHIAARHITSHQITFRYITSHHITFHHIHLHNDSLSNLQILFWLMPLSANH